MADFNSKVRYNLQILADIQDPFKVNIIRKKSILNSPLLRLLFVISWDREQYIIILTNFM